MYNPFNYDIGQVQKAVISFVYLVGVLVMLIFFNDADLSLIDALVAIIGPAFGVVTVFLAKNSTADDVQKALEQLKATAITFISFFVAVPSSTNEKLALLIGGIVSAFLVFKRTNDPADNPADVPPPA